MTLCTTRICNGEDYKGSWRIRNDFDVKWIPSGLE